MTPIEQIVLNKIQTNNGIKRIHLHEELIKSSAIPMMNLRDLRMILAELLALGHVVEIEYIGDNKVREFFYIPAPCDVKFRGKE